MSRVFFALFKLFLNKTWATRTKEEQRLVMAQRAMERSRLGISLHEDIQREIIQEGNRVKYSIVKYQKEKFYCVGHINHG